MKMKMSILKSQAPTIPNSFTFQEAKDQFLLHCRAKNLADRTISFYSEKLECFEKFLKQDYPDISFSSINSTHIKHFLIYLQNKEHRTKELSSYTIKGIFVAIKVFFNFLCEDEEKYIQSNPCEKIKAPKIQKRIIKPLSEIEIKNLLKVFNRKTFTGYRNYTMSLIFLDTGIRLSELINLKIEDINWIRCTFLILGKGNKEREVPFGNMIAKILQKYLKKRKKIPGQDYVFVNEFGQIMKKRHIQKIVQEAGRKAGIKRLHPHLLRHSSAISWIRKGGDCLSLQKLLGHSSLEMVRNYVNLSSDDVIDKHKKFGLIDNLGLRR